MTPSRGPGQRAIPEFRRRSVHVSEDALVRTKLLEPASEMPLMIVPAVLGVDLPIWAARNRPLVEQLLSRHGGVLFRGFEVASPDAFASFVAAVSDGALEYNERSSPRSEVIKNIYTSTEYPPSESIFLHNENSYQRTWPSKIAFYCDVPAATGGETPIADCRIVYHAIHPEIRERFAEKGWMYVRNFSERLGLPWQTVFQTRDHDKVDEYCSKNGISTEWLPGGGLRTHARRDAVVRHPRTGEWIWFNHAVFFHVSTLEAAIREPLLAAFSERDLPAHSFYGDGSPIEPATVEALRAAYRSATIAFPWQRGDVLLLDNMLVAHGRSSFTGSRRVLVCMADPWPPPA